MVWDVINSVGVVAAIAIGVFSGLQARRSAVEAKRQNDLAEREANRYVTPWRIERVEGKNSLYSLKNEGDEEALDVRIDGETVSNRVVHAQQSQFALVSARSAVTFHYVPHMGTKDFDVLVTWRRPSETETREWRCDPR